MSETTHIYLNASELAIALGLNPYQNIRDLVVKYWGRYFPEDYYRLLDDIKKQNKVEIIQETEYQCLQRLSQQASNTPQLQKKINEVLSANKTQDTKELQQKQKEVVNDLKKDTSLSADDKETLTKLMTSMSNRRFGTRKESSSISEYERLTNKTVQRVGKYFTKTVDTVNNCSTYELLPTVVWNFRGKIDGLTTDNELVEVKNRVNCFFKTIKNYEKVQIQTYLYLLDLEVGFLVESLVKKKGEAPLINVVPTSFDKTFWEGIVLARTYKFIDFFQHLLFDDDYKMRLLIQDEKTMEKEIREVLGY